MKTEGTNLPRATSTILRHCLKGSLSQHSAADSIYLRRIRSILLKRAYRRFVNTLRISWQNGLLLP